ncbi:hypothetical protein [Nonomuraea sp. SYSU D8015]|uniref:hypothetical protein n=1 Tax=Nonomuraea sp. SYSU D8015 TaxID=2593644 RepID=UPI001CB6E231|nr:hypothetical protein [Nonomuraea sp. SYSU D8015]
MVSLLGGDPETVAEIRPLLAGLAEAVHFAGRHGLELSTFQAAIDSGPMACDVTRVKIPKLIARDFSVQAATSDAFNNTCLIADAARAAGVLPGGRELLPRGARIHRGRRPINRRPGAGAVTSAPGEGPDGSDGNHRHRHPQRCHTPRPDGVL